MGVEDPIERYFAHFESVYENHTKPQENKLAIERYIRQDENNQRSP
jgi:hypothetical protein